MSSRNEQDDELLRQSESLLASLLHEIESNSSDRGKIGHALQFLAKAATALGQETSLLERIKTLKISLYLLEIRADRTTIIASILRDASTYPSDLQDQVRQAFGEIILSISRSLHKIKAVYDRTEIIRESQSARNLFVAMARDPRAIIIALATAVYDAEHCTTAAEEKKILKTIHYIYAPLAERIGAYKIQNDLQDILFRSINPELHASISNRLFFLRKETQVDIDNFIAELSEILRNSGIKAEVDGRQKTPYSIWQKMERKQIPFERLSDIFAFRILTDKVQDCYLALGYIHMRYRAQSGCFVDYISTPKSNSYQSLHTVITDSHQRSIEIQIRTKQMHEIAEFGIAAHWKYKQISFSNSNHEEMLAKQTYDILHDFTPQALDDIHSRPEDVNHHDQIFCFTPRGEIISLNQGATALDFAFTVHTDLGFKATYAKINNRVVYLNHQLSNGDQVKIMQALKPQVTSEWLDFVVTAKAKNEIKRLLKQQSFENLTSLGRALLIKQMRRLNMEYNELTLQQHLGFLQCTSIDDLLYKVGLGIISSVKVIATVMGYEDTKRNAKKPLLFLKSLIRKSRLKLADNNPTAAIAFANNTHNSIPRYHHSSSIKLAKCCYPLPGEEIVGWIRPGQHVEVHTIECNSLKNVDQTHEIFEMSWIGGTGGVQGGAVYLCRLSISITNEIGSLASILFIVAQYRISINNIKITRQSRDVSKIFLDIEIKGIDHTRKLIEKLCKMPNVYHCSRYRSHDMREEMREEA